MAKRRKANQRYSETVRDKSLVTTQIYLDYFDEDRKKEFSSANNKYLKNLIEEINFLKDEVLKIKSINV